MNISYHGYSGKNDHVISIISVLLKCAGDVQKVLTHKSLYQVLYKINKQQIKWLCLHNHENNNITNDAWNLNENLIDNSLIAYSNIEYKCSNKALIKIHKKVTLTFQPLNKEKG